MNTSYFSGKSTSRNLGVEEKMTSVKPFSFGHYQPGRDAQPIACIVLFLIRKGIREARVVLASQGGISVGEILGMLQPWKTPKSIITAYSARFLFGD